MDKTAEKPVNTRIPTQVNEKEFNEFFLPHLSMPKRGPKCKIGYHRVFNYILKVLYTGMQWKEELQYIPPPSPLAELPLIVQLVISGEDDKVQ